MASPVLVPRLGYGAEPAVITEWYHPDGATVRRGEAVCCLESGYVTIDLEADDDGILRHFTGDGPAPEEGEPVAFVLAPGERLPAPPEPAPAPELSLPSPEPLPFPPQAHAPEDEARAEAPNALWDDAPAPVIDFNAPLLRRRTVAPQTGPAYHWSPEAEAWPESRPATTTSDDHADPSAALAPDPAEAPPRAAWDQAAEDTFAAALPDDDEAPAAPEPPAALPSAWAAWEAAPAEDEPDLPLAGALYAESSTWKAFEDIETAAGPYTGDDQPHAADPVAIHIVHPEPLGEDAVPEPAEEPYRWFDEEAPAEVAAEPLEESAPYVVHAPPAPAAAVPLTMRVTVALGDAMKLRERLAHDWAPDGVIPVTEDLVLRALACALAGQPALEAHARAVGLRTLDREGVTVQLFPEAGGGDLRDVVEARATVPSWPATDAHCTATLTSLFDFGIDDSVPALAPGDALAVSLGAPRRVASFRPNGLEVITVSTVTLAYDPGTVFEGTAAAFLAGLRDLLESPETLLAA